MPFSQNDTFNKDMANIIGKERVKELEQKGYLAAQIIIHRRKKKWSQQDLSEEVGVAKSTIGRLEAGLTQPNYQTLVALSSKLETPLIIDAHHQDTDKSEILPESIPK